MKNIRVLICSFFVLFCCFCIAMDFYTIHMLATTRVKSVPFKNIYITIIILVLKAVQYWTLQILVHAMSCCISAKKNQDIPYSCIGELYQTANVWVENQLHPLSNLVTVTQEENSTSLTAEPTVLHSTVGAIFNN